MNIALAVLFGVAVLGGLAGYAEAQLWVSVQNEDNVFAGAQIVHIIVDTRDRIVDVSGEPTVTVKGKTIRMVQVTDGRWHAYFADKDSARAADATVIVPGNGLDFGTICNTDNDANELLESITLVTQNYFTDASGVAFPLDGMCDESYGDNMRIMSVLRKERGANLLHGIGQSIDVDRLAVNAAQRVWPFIQLYEFSSNVEVKHDDQRVSLEYGSIDDYAQLRLDRTLYPLGSDIHVEITNPLFNIDPTDSDSWTWDIDGDGKGRLIYRAFDLRGAATGNTSDVSGALDNLGCEDTCTLGIKLDGGIIETVQNGNGGTSLGASTTNDGLITLVETMANTGVFVSYDSGNNSSLKVTSDAPRGTALTVDYVTKHSVSVDNSDATLDFGAGSQWPSGTRAPIILHDNDVNKNTKQKETLDVSDPRIIIPTIITGSPLTLRDAIGITTRDANGILDNMGLVTIDEHGARALYSPLVPFESIIVDFGRMRDEMNILPSVNNLLNYDMRSLGSQILDINVLAGNSPIVNGESLAYDLRVPIAVRAAPRDLVEISDSALEAIATHEYASLEFDMLETVSSSETFPLVADIVSFGIIDGMRVINQVIRIELEETGEDTGMFAGTLEYMLANQNSITDPRVYSDLATISDRASMLATNTRDDVTLDYLDRTSDGSDKIISSVVAFKSHTGTISFDRSEFQTSDIVLVTLDDADLNTNSNTIETYSVGSTNGELLVLTLNGIVWREHAGCDAPNPDLRLVETDRSSGIFTGELFIPRYWCDGESSKPRNTAGTKIGITYADYISDTGNTNRTVVDLGDKSSTLEFPIVLGNIELEVLDLQSVQTHTTALSAPRTEFEFIVQITNPHNIVEQIIIQDALVDTDGTIQISIKLNFDINIEHDIRVFAWNKDGIVLAEPRLLQFGG